MRKLINVVHRERKPFPKHFLASVFSEIRYPTIGSRAILENKEAFLADVMALGFTECRNIMQGTMTIHNEPDQPARMSQESATTGLMFLSQNPRRELKVEADKLVYSDYSYEGIDVFIGNFKSCYDAISHHIGLSENTPVDKIGLRKIDSVQLKPVVDLYDALDIFNPALFSLVRSGLLVQDAIKGTEETAVLEDDEKLCVLKSQLIKKDKDSFEVNLDFDLLSLSKTTFQNAFSEVIPSLNQYHFDLFMWAVTEKMINILEKN